MAAAISDFFDTAANVPVPTRVFRDDTCRESLTDIALKLRERVYLGPQRRYRLVGVGLSNFRESEELVVQPALFE